MWRQFTFSVVDNLADPLSDALSELGALSVSLEDGGDQPLFEPKPGETPLWRTTRVTGLFEAGVDASAVRAALASQFSAEVLASLVVSELADQVWERVWLEHFKPMRFGERLWVCPSDFELPDPDAVNIILDPGLAFGTGTHPTTALCLEWLATQSLEGKTVIDYGCGSGILAVAALKLGAARALGVDLDPQALTASAENARKNGVDDRLTLFLPGQLGQVMADVLVANILAGPLIGLADILSMRLTMGGTIVLSGILAGQAPEVARAYQACMALLPPVQREDWVLLSGRKVAD